jgi:glycosyltransferase involved in cell wall biosynthesis
MSDKRTSVIMPVYNGAAYLNDAVTSILRQTHAPHEIIIVDDGSTDGSHQIAKAFPPVVRYLCKENGGPASARNFGIANATGDFLAFIDQDDLWNEAKLARQMACFDAEPSLELCYTLVDLFWDSALANEESGYSGHARTRNVPGYVMPTLLGRRAAFDRVGPLDESLVFGDGTDWAMRAIDAGLHVKLLPEVLLYHRMHKDNLTRDRERSQREFIRIVRSRLDRLRKDGKRQGA